MAAFLTAEVLAQRSVSDSQIEHAMDTAQHHQHSYIVNQPQQKGILHFLAHSVGHGFSVSYFVVVSVWVDVLLLS